MVLAAPIGNPCTLATSTMFVGTKVHRLRRLRRPSKKTIVKRYCAGQRAPHRCRSMLCNAWYAESAGVWNDVEHANAFQLSATQFVSRGGCRSNRTTLIIRDISGGRRKRRNERAFTSETSSTNTETTVSDRDRNRDLWVQKSTTGAIERVWSACLQRPQTTNATFICGETIDLRWALIKVPCTLAC